MTTVIGGSMSNDTITISNGGISTGSVTVSSSSLGYGMFDMEDFLDTHSFNKITVEHKVAEFELTKLKETVPTYADEIKENLSRSLSREIIKKASFTKKRDIDADVHHFIGRVWVFTEDELKKLIEEARNAK